MRILIVSPGSHRKEGGIQYVERMVYRALKDLCPNADIHLQLLLDDGSSENHGQPGIEPMPFASWRGYGGSRIGFAIGTLATALFGRWDWILCSHGYLSPLCWIARTLGGPEHVLLVHYQEMVIGQTPLRRFCMARAKQVIAVSEFSRQTFLSRISRDVIVNKCLLGLGEDTGEVARQMPPRSDLVGRKVILIVGRMVQGRDKGHAALIRAMAFVLTKVPTAVLCIVGRGPGEPSLRALATELGVASSVIFAGFAAPDELKSYYGSSAVFAMPSDSEGFGLVYLEAMRAGCACIGGNNDAAREIIQDGVTGFVCDPTKTRELAERLLFLIQDSDAARTMGEAGRLRWRQLFTYSEFRLRLSKALGDSLLTPTAAPNETEVV
jgi:phosphatidyl-myo-inositol dimannoside synthase